MKTITAYQVELDEARAKPVAWRWERGPGNWRVETVWKMIPVSVIREVEPLVPASALAAYQAELDEARANAAYWVKQHDKQAALVGEYARSSAAAEAKVAALKTALVEARTVLTTTLGNRVANAVAILDAALGEG